MMIYSGLILNCIPAAMLFRPFTFWTGGKPFNPQAAAAAAAAKAAAAEAEAAKITDANSNQTNKEAGNGTTPDTGLLVPQEKHLGLSSDDLRPRALTGSSMGQLSKSKLSLYASQHSLAFSPHQEPPADAQDDEEDQEPEPPKPTPTGCARFCGCCAMFDWGLFKNWLFVIYVCGLSCGHGGYINVCMFLPAYAVENGVEKQMVAVLLGVVGMADLVGRVLGGWFADLGKKFSKKLLPSTINIHYVIKT